MRVLFVVSDPIMYIRLGVLILSSVIRLRGHESRIAYATDLRDGEKRTRLMEEYRPKVVAYSGATGEHLLLLEVNAMLKAEHSFFALFGGPHATFCPSLAEEPGVDGICVGEGDEALPEFLELYASGGEYWKVRNMHIRLGEKIHRNPLRPLIKDLDSLPFADHETMFQADPELYRDGMFTFIASRGCPFHCSYCFNQTYNELYDHKDILRHRSPESIIEEICRVRDRFSLRFVFFYDDTFLLKPEGWFDRFAELYIAKVGMPFLCTVRANLVREDVITLLRKAGLHSVWMGVECGDQQVAREGLRRGLTNEQLLSAARIIQKHGIVLTSQNLVGLPVPDTYEVDLRTLDLNIELAPTYAWSSILYPYPGTDIAAMARSGGLTHGSVPFLETNKRSTVLDFPLKLKKRVENLHKLFGLIVRFPFLRPFTDFLCDLPLGRVYLVFYYLMYGYYLKFRMQRISLARLRLWNYVKLFFRMLNKT